METLAKIKLLFEYLLTLILIAGALILWILSTVIIKIIEIKKG